MKAIQSNTKPITLLNLFHFDDLLFKTKKTAQKYSLLENKSKEAFREIYSTDSCKRKILNPLNIGNMDFDLIKICKDRYYIDTSLQGEVAYDQGLLPMIWMLFVISTMNLINKIQIKMISKLIIVLLQNIRKTYIYSIITTKYHFNSLISEKLMKYKRYIMKTKNSSKKIDLNIGNTVYNLRTRKRMSLKELSKQTNISYSYLIEIEKNEKVPSLEKLKNICDALTIPIEVLLFLAKNDEMMHNQIQDQVKKKFLENVSLEMNNLFGLLSYK